MSSHDLPFEVEDELARERLRDRHLAESTGSHSAIETPRRSSSPEFQYESITPSPIRISRSRSRTPVKQQGEQTELT